MCKKIMLYYYNENSVGAGEGNFSLVSQLVC